MGHRVGYIRVSSGDQQPARQLDQVAVDRVFIEYASGKDIHRPQLEQLLAFVRAGDTVVVHSLDRLARNLADLRQLVARLTHQGVRVEFVHEQLTFTGDDSPMAQLMLSVMGAFAEFERALLRDTATRRHCFSQTTGRLSGPQARLDGRASAGAPAAGAGRGSEDGPRPGLWN